VTVSDRESHLFSAALGTSATTGLSPAEVAWLVRAVRRDQAKVTMLMSEVTGVDRAAKTVYAAGAAPADRAPQSLRPRGELGLKPEHRPSPPGAQEVTLTIPFSDSEQHR
jgi:hypothetical protein